MAITFPESPAVDDLFEASPGRVFRWTGERWRLNSTTNSGASAEIIRSTVLPAADPSQLGRIRLHVVPGEPDKLLACRMLADGSTCEWQELGWAETVVSGPDASRRSGQVLDLAGPGDPEGIVPAPRASTWRNTTSGEIFRKASASGATGWETLSGFQPVAAILTQLSGLPIVHGDVLFVGSSGLTRLAAGTAGQFLRTNGEGEDPSWAAGAGGSGGAMSLEWGFDSYDPDPTGIVPQIVHRAGQITSIGVAVQIPDPVATSQWRIIKNGSIIHTLSLAAAAGSARNGSLALSVAAGDVLTIDPISTPSASPAQYGAVSLLIES